MDFEQVHFVRSAEIFSFLPPSSTSSLFSSAPFAERPAFFVVGTSPDSVPDTSTDFNPVQSWSAAVEAVVLPVVVVGVVARAALQVCAFDSASHSSLLLISSSSGGPVSGNEQEVRQRQLRDLIYPVVTSADLLRMYLERVDWDGEYSPTHFILVLRQVADIVLDGNVSRPGARLVESNARPHVSRGCRR